MAEKIRGRVEYINEYDAKSKSGKRYSLKVDGTNYGVGIYPPRGIEQGDTVEFEVEYNGNWPNVARGTLRKIEGGAPARSSPPSRTASPKANAFDDRQDIISKQAALNTALAFLELANKNETLPVPKSKNQGYGYLRTLWMQEAARLYELNTGKEWVIPDEETDVEEEAPKPARKKAAAKRVAKKPEPEEPSWEDEDWADSDADGDTPW